MEERKTIIREYYEFDDLVEAIHAAETMEMHYHVYRTTTRSRGLFGKSTGLDVWKLVLFEVAE